jgi:ABC-type antimicrobial peptide transport system permease subunit
MTGVLREAMWAPRVGSALLTVFGAIALVLAVVGMYGVTAFLVRRRQREIGIRIAIGATPLRILGGVVSWTLMPALAGIVLGLGLARICARLSDGLLIGGAVSDVRSFAGAAAVLVVSAAVASLLPALAALRLDPTLALRRD